MSAILFSPRWHHGLLTFSHRTSRFTQPYTTNCTVTIDISVMCMAQGGMASAWIMMTSSNGNIFRVTGPFPSQRPVTQSFDVFSDLRLNKRLSKQSWQSRRRWFETPSHSLWRHCNVYWPNEPSSFWISPGNRWSLIGNVDFVNCYNHSYDDVMTRKRCPHYWPFVRRIYR